MEPEVIRMYSSSPPPLDSVADDDDEDDFGEFGGFSAVSNSGIGFADFDAVSYPKSREDFIPSNHFMPIHDYSDNVNNFSSLTSIADAEIVSEITTSKKGPCKVLETNASNEPTPCNFATLEKKGSSGEKEIEVDLHAKSEDGFSSVGHTELNFVKDEQTAGTCNGEKAHCLENLTNGFSVVDTVDPQGIEDLDRVNDSKGFKASSTQSTDPTVDFTQSPEEEFADFSKFPKKYSTNLEDSDLTTHRGLHEGQSVKTEESSPLDRVVVDSDSINHDEPSELDHTICTSEVDTTAVDSVALHTTTALPPDINAHASTVSQLMDTETTEDLEEPNQSVEEAFETTDVGSTDDNSDLVGIVQNPSQNLISDDGCCRGHLSNVSKDNNSHENVLSADDPDCEQDESGRSRPLSSRGSSESHENAYRDQSEFSSNVTEIDDFGGFEEVNTVTFEEEAKETSTERSAFQEPGEKYCEFESPDDSESFEFGDFNSMAKNDDPGSFPESDDFADFSSAGNTDQPGGWKAFEDDQTEGSTWAAFGHDDTEQSLPDSESWQSHRTNVPSRDQAINTQSGVTPAFHESESTFISDGSTSGSQQSLLSRLERIIQVCFPSPPVSETEENILSLNHLLIEKLEETTKTTSSSSREVLDIWPELQDIHDAYGLKHQWGGSHSNKKLLCSLGIDTRNILFTGNKKQPVIVPMYAAGLGMLEPTKEPLKPLSAAEKIASIGQSSPVHPPDSICTSDQLQDSLPPVQFDWSSSGLTNPLDGVDPELYALTTSKVESSAASSRVTDAFARLMSTAETTSTSTRKPKREENLSEEAAKVIASLPDLSFMHAKVLMFPATLTPSMSSQEKVD